MYLQGSLLLISVRWSGAFAIVGCSVAAAAVKAEGRLRKRASSELHGEFDCGADLYPRIIELHIPLEEPGSSQERGGPYRTIF